MALVCKIESKAVRSNERKGEILVLMSNKQTKKKKHCVKALE